MNIAIVGKAKTGTTAIQAAIAESAPAKMHALFEPKSAEEVLTACDSGTHVISKIIFEHWNTNLGILRDVLNDKDNVKFEKVVFIKRDPRDEIVSRILYVIFPLYQNNRVTTDQFRKWKALLVKKDRDPTISFLQLCADFEDIFGVDIKTNVIKHAIDDTVEYNKFIVNMDRDYCILRYENFIDNATSALNEYLGFQVEKVMVDPRYDRVRRTSGYGDWKNMMVNSDIEFLKDMENGVFSEFGYKSWDTSDPPPKVNSYAEYVERIVGSRITS